MNDRKDDFLKLVISKDTIDIPRYLSEHRTGQYKDFVEFVDVDILQHRVNRLLGYTLIKHSEEEQGTEQYKLTDDGRKVLQIMEEIIRIAT